MKTKEELIAFEEEVIQMYKDGKLRSPIHLSRGNEEELIEIFKQIKPNDWVFSTYRSHYHALLKGISEDWLKNWILNNKSIHVMNKQHKFWTSAIVGGCIPIALGVAMAIKRDYPYGTQTKEIEEIKKPYIPHVWIFVGDMTSMTGGFWEAWNYACNHDLPITFVVEDNGLSTDTPTKEVWNTEGLVFEGDSERVDYSQIDKKLIYYKYKRGLPHYGTGEFVDFKEEKLKQDGSNF